MPRWPSGARRARRGEITSSVWACAIRSLSQADIVPGVLFIDEAVRESSMKLCGCFWSLLTIPGDLILLCSASCMGRQVHMLDIECFSFLNRALEAGM